jgi:two-component system, OmpR family, sensor kinase
MRLLRLRRAARPSRRSLRTRLVLATILLTAAVSLVIGLVSVGALKLFLEQRLDAQLTSAVRRSRVAVDRPNELGFSGIPPLLAASNRGRNSPNLGGPGFLLTPGQGQGTLGALIDSDEVVTRAGVLDSTGSPAALTSREKARLTAVPVDEKPHTVDFGAGLGSYRLLAQHTSRGETIITGLPLSSVYAAVFQLSAVVVAVSLVGLLAVAIIGAAIVRRTLRPLNRVAATATQVSELPLDRGEVALAVRVPDRDTDLNTEVGQVGAALNRMLGHVAAALQARQASEARVRRFVADASHELRTPLASIRGYAELTRRSRLELPADVAHALSRVESEAIRMTGLVEELLLLARLDEGRPADRAPVDLSRLLVDATGDAHAAGPEHRWQLDLPEQPVIVVGDRSQLHQVVANLLANARVHTPVGTWVGVGLSLPAVDPPTGRAEVVLEVTDDGPGISPELLPEVFERFARGDGSRSRGNGTGSTGLGLSIVAAVVAAHGGRVDVTSRPGRTRFAVHLPLAPDPQVADPQALDPQAPDPQVAASTSNATSSRSEEKARTARNTASATASAS